MMSLHVATDNAAFEGDNIYPECIRILRLMADKLEQGQNFAVIHDLNGNRVGVFEIERDEDDMVI